MKITVLGAGSWGTTLAVLLGSNGHDVKLWCRREELAKEIEATKENKQYLPGIKIPRNVISDSSLKNMLADTEMIVSVIPSEYLRQTIQKVKPCYNGQLIVSATKGFEHDTGKRMSQVIENELNAKNIAVLSGPNHAEEISIGLPTASVMASIDRKTAGIAAEALSAKNFKIYQLNDVVGVETCGALKNVSAIAIGVVDGFGFGDNAKSSIITLGLMEMNNFGRHFGAKRGTVYGLAGVGDLIATCISKHSRNRFVGEQLSKGKAIKQIREDMKGMVAEGIPTTKAVYEYSKKHGIEMPLTEQAYKVLFENKNIKEAVKDLLAII